MMRSQLAHQGGGALRGLRGCGCTAEIFVGYGPDGLAQFERIHFVFLAT